MISPEYATALYFIAAFVYFVVDTFITGYMDRSRYLEISIFCFLCCIIWPFMLVIWFGVIMSDIGRCIRVRREAR